jgi:hypothetical protein
MKNPSEYAAFTQLVDKVLTVPHSVIQERVEEYRKQADKNPRKRGKKRQTKPSASSRGSNDRT